MTSYLSRGTREQGTVRNPDLDISPAISCGLNTAINGQEDKLPSFISTHQLCSRRRYYKQINWIIWLRLQAPELRKIPTCGEFHYLYGGGGAHGGTSS